MMSWDSTASATDLDVLRARANAALGGRLSADDAVSAAVDLARRVLDATDGGRGKHHAVDLLAADALVTHAIIGAAGDREQLLAWCRRSIQQFSNASGS